MGSQLGPFQTEVHGKWILSGEHAVLRGFPALVFPVYNRFLRLHYRQTDLKIQAQFEGPFGEELRLLFWGILRRALETLQRAEEELTGEFQLINGIPVGAGMGASAALSVAIARWCQFQNWISEEELFEFSRQLENLFHGESSGVDIAVALSSQGIKFYRSQEYWPPIQLRWHPHWYLSYSGKKGMTSDCVNQVKKFGESHPLEARALDEKMLQSVELAEKALSASGSEEDLLQLKQSLDLGLESFSGWGLTTGVLGDHIQQLKDYGALAVKPTGSGDGGYVLSLWRQPPINVSPIDFIPL